MKTSIRSTRYFQISLHGERLPPAYISRAIPTQAGYRMPFDSHSCHQAGQGIKDLTLGFQVIITFLPYSLKLCTGSSSSEWNWIAAKPASLLTSQLMCFSPSDSCTIMCGVLLLPPAENNFFLVLGDTYVSPLAIDLYQSNLIKRIWHSCKSKYFLNWLV